MHKGQQCVEAEKGRGVIEVIKPPAALLLRGLERCQPPGLAAGGARNGRYACTAAVGTSARAAKGGVTPT